MGKEGDLLNKGWRYWEVDGRCGPRANVSGRAGGEGSTSKGKHWTGGSREKGEINTQKKKRAKPSLKISDQGVREVVLMGKGKVGAHADHSYRKIR